MPTKLQQKPEIRVEPGPELPKMNVGGAALLSLAGAAGIALGILGFTQVPPPLPEGIALIVLGGGLVLASGLFRTPGRTAQAWPRSGRRTATGRFSAEVVLGSIAAVLGILALTRATEINLTAIGVIALGVALWVGTSAEVQMGLSALQSRRAGRTTVSWIFGLSMIVGIGAVLLGILSLIGISPRILNLISVIGVGCAMLLTGSVVTRAVSRPAAR